MLIPTVVIVYYRNIRTEDPFNENYQFVKILDGLDKPVFITHAGDARLFIVEQAGRILVWDGEQTREFLDIRSLVDDSSSERGLLSLAFAPKNNDVFYVYYTEEPTGGTIVSRYQVSDSDPNHADPASAQPVLDVRQPYANHNGGSMAFGKDGYLYIGLGDGGSGGDPQGNGQNLDTLLGKILRLNVSDGLRYSIPPDNPFVRLENARPEIWAYGLRNPWRFSFDRETGDLYIGDVGQNEIEEIDFQPASSTGGENYGWNLYEGDQAYTENAVSTGLVMPIVAYHHDEDFLFVEKWVTHTAHCSVTGGYVYRGTALPDLQGAYIYGDFCSGTIWELRREGDTWKNTPFIPTAFIISSFGEDSSGELYLANWTDGEVWQLTAH